MRELIADHYLVEKFVVLFEEIHPIYVTQTKTERRFQKEVYLVRTTPTSPFHHRDGIKNVVG
jgi:hypothetical protein